MSSQVRRSRGHSCLPARTSCMEITVEEHCYCTTSSTSLTLNVGPGAPCCAHCAMVTCLTSLAFSHHLTGTFRFGTPRLSCINMLLSFYTFKSLTNFNSDTTLAAPPNISANSDKQQDHNRATNHSALGSFRRTAFIRQRPVCSHPVRVRAYAQLNTRTSTKEWNQKIRAENVFNPTRSLNETTGWIR